MLMKYTLKTMCALLALAVVLVAGNAVAHPVQVPEKVKAVMIGDRLIDVSLNLGVLPEGMSLRCSLWPKCKQIRLTSQVLGCPNCVITKRPKSLVAFMKKHNITRLILEKSEPFCLYTKTTPVDAAELVKDLPGVRIEYVDFTKGIESAVVRTAKLLGKEARAGKVIATYHKRMQRVEKNMPKTALGKRVLVLNGVYSPSTGKTFIRIEAPGGYTDQYILEPLGCTNAGKALIDDDKRISKGHVMAGKLKTLVKASPDVIAMTGNAFAVQLALRQAVAENPELAEIPALKNGALYSLPLYVDSGVLEYPMVFNQWAQALEQ